MDYSENLSQMYKFELQSSHFNKKQYSLHCTVKHRYDRETSSEDYIYHLSNDVKQDHAFTSSVVENLRQDHDKEQIGDLKT